MRKLKGLLGILLLIGVAFSPVMAANLYWKTTLADLTAIAGASDGDRGLVIGPAGDVTFYLHSGGLWIPATTSVSWNLVTDRPTINGVTITGAVLDNASNYPTLNQNTTGNAATATTLSGAVSWDNITNKPTIGGVEIIGAVLDNSGLYPILNQSTVGNAATATTADSLAAQYIDWSQASGPTSVANRPTINGVNVTGAVLDNALNYPAVVDVTAGGFLKKTGTTGATLGLWDNCASNEIPKWNGAAWTCASDAQSAGDNPVFDNVQSGTNTASTMTVGTGGTLTYSGSGIVNASQFQGAATIPWSLLTSVPTFNSQTLSGAMLDNVSNYPTFNQNTTGTAGGLVFGLDARGDLAVRGASAYGRLGIGSAGKILGTDGTDPAWSAYTLATPGASGAVLYSNGTNWTRSAAPAISAASMTSFPTLNQNTTGTAANLSGTPTLPNGTAATTQYQADASTKLATTAYVDTGLDGLAPLVSPSFTTPSLGVARSHPALISCGLARDTKRSTTVSRIIHQDARGSGMSGPSAQSTTAPEGAVVLAAGSRAARPGARGHSSTKASSRLFFTAGSSTMTSSSAAAASRPADSGRVTNTLQSPRDSSSARRRFSSIIGPRIRPSNKGAGSVPSLWKM